MRASTVAYRCPPWTSTTNCYPANIHESNTSEEPAMSNRRRGMTEEAADAAARAASDRCPTAGSSLNSSSPNATTGPGVGPSAGSRLRSSHARSPYEPSTSRPTPTSTQPPSIPWRSASGQERQAVVSDRGLRHRQVPPAHRTGHRGRDGRLPGQYPLATQLANELVEAADEKASVAIASDESFSGWPKTFIDPRPCGAIVDRCLPAPARRQPPHRPRRALVRRAPHGDALATARLVSG